MVRIIPSRCYWSSRVQLIIVQAPIPVRASPPDDATASELAVSNHNAPFKVTRLRDRCFRGSVHRIASSETLHLSRGDKERMLVHVLHGTASKCAEQRLDRLATQNMHDRASALSVDYFAGKENFS